MSVCKEWFTYTPFMIYHNYRKGGIYMKNVTNVIDYVLIGSGVCISLIDIQQWLSIIILVLDVIWILGKLGFKIYTAIKEKKYGDAVQSVKDASDELKEIEQRIPKEEPKETKEIPHGKE